MSIATLDITIPDDFSLDDLSIMTSGTTDGRKKIQSAIVTFWPPDDDTKWLYPLTYFPAESLTNWCAKFESCPETGKLHVHAWVEFTHANKPRFQALANAFAAATGTHPRIDVTKKLTKLSRKCAVNYVLKSETSHQDIPAFIWELNRDQLAFDDELWNNRQEQTTSKKREQREKERLWIESKPRHWSWDEIVHECDESKALLCGCAWGKGYHAGRIAENGRRSIENVVILYGAGGTGKTTLAKSWDKPDDVAFEEFYYRRNTDDGLFWGGGKTAYRGQSLIHYDEFCGNETFGRLKEICDVKAHGPPVNVKNGGTTLNHDTVVFTSNYHPAGWYRKLWEGDKKQFHPFWRRITKVLFFPATREDGTDNVPDENNPPYYIDQTDQWKDFGGCYDSALAHASQYWPLKDHEDISESGFHRDFVAGQSVSNKVRDEFHEYCLTNRFRT